ncbi:hypothetical protein ACHAXT_004528 [Thalassiosira profunda]
MKLFEHCNPCPPPGKGYRCYDHNHYRHQRMLPYHDAGPPPVVTTVGDLKGQYGFEPDSAASPGPNRRAETRGEYNWAPTRGGNSLVVGDERDTRVPTSGFTYGGRAALSPRQYQGQQLSSREVGNYKAAIQQVEESMANSGRSGSVTALRGLWKVFDAAVSELGTELNDSLSNKAIFEANVMQESMQRQGRRVNDFEKKSDALARKSHYEATLQATLLRLRGSFADVILGTKKEIQGSIDRSFESFVQDRLAAQAADMEKTYAKRMIATERTYAAQTAEVVAVKDKQVAEATARLQQQKDASNQELARLIETNNMAQAKLNEAALIQAQVAQERQGYAQAIAAAEKGREDAVATLASTLETLQAQCSAAQAAEGKLAEAGMQLQQVEERLELSEHERRQEAEQFDAQWKVENERADLLTQKLEAEGKALRQMEEHLGLERERADLLQQHLDQEKEVVRSLKEADRQRRDDAERARHQHEESLRRLDKTSEMTALLEAKAERLEAKIADQEMDLEAARMSEADVEKSLAESLARGDDLEERLRHTVCEMETVAQQLANECRERQEKTSALKEREEETATLRGEKADLEAVRDTLKDQLTKIEREHSKLRKVSAENDALKEKLSKVEEDYGQDRDKIAAALAGFDEEMTNAEEKLRKVMVELEAERKKVKAMSQAQDRAVATDSKLRQSLEKEKAMLKESFEAEVAKGTQDMAVYEEAIKMLQKQVDILQELADADCEKCAMRDAELEADEKDAHVTNGELQGVKEGLLAQLEAQKMAHETAMKAKDAELKALRDSGKAREESMENLEGLCAKARTDLAELRSQKTFLEGSLDKSIKFINDLKAAQRDDEKSSKRSSVRFQDEMNFDAVDELILKSCSTVKDLGADLDSLLAGIEHQLFGAHQLAQAKHA